MIIIYLFMQIQRIYKRQIDNKYRAMVLRSVVFTQGHAPA